MKKRMCVFLSAFMVFGLFAACGSASSADWAEATAPSYVEEAAMDFGMSNGYDEEYSYNDSASSMKGDSEYSQKIVMTYSYNLETTDFDKSYVLVTGKVAEYGGYIENMSSSGQAPYRYASFTIRIPENKVDAFLEETGNMGNLTSQSASQEDITSSYYDVASRLESLNTQHKRLLELMEDAETIEDIITLEQRLSDIEYQLGSYESQMKIYENRVNYATVYIYLDEVSTISVVSEDSFGQRIVKGLSTTFSDLGYDIENFVIWFIVNLPYIVIWVMILYVAYRIIRALRIRSAKRRDPDYKPLSRKEKKAAKKAAKLAKKKGGSGLDNFDE